MAPVSSVPTFAPIITNAIRPTSFVRIVHNNDPHEHWQNLPKTVTAFQQLSQQGQQSGFDVLKLNSGDNNTFKEPNEWALSVMLNNLMGLDASTLGNHELDLDIKDLVGGIQQYAQYPTLVSNLKIPANHPLTQLYATSQFKPSVHLVQGRYGTYALLGITRPTETAKLSKSIRQTGLDSITFNQTAQQLQQITQQLEAQGINRIVLLSHMGYKLDRQLAQKVNGIDVIVGGDSHDEIRGITPGQNFLTSARGEPVLILQAGWNGSYVGTADIAFNQAGCVIPLSSQLHSTAPYPSDPQATALMQQALPPQRLIANLAHPFSVEGIQTGPNAFGNFLADSARSLAGSDIALVRAPQIRKTLEAGTLSNWQLKEAMPYGGEFVTLQLTGQEIQEALNQSAQGLNPNDNMRGTQRASLLHPSGLRMQLNPYRGKAENITVFNRQSRQYEPLNPTKTYTVTLDDYTLYESEEFPSLAKPERIVKHTGLPLRGIFEWGANSRRALQIPLALPPIDNRLLIRSH